MKASALKVVLSALIIIAPMFGLAQDRGTMGDMQKRLKEQRDKTKKDLKLKKQQVADFDKAYAKYDKARNDLRSGSRTGDREAMREKMDKMRVDLNKELKEVLTADQFKKLEEIEKKNRAQRGTRGQGDRGGRGGGR